MNRVVSYSAVFCAILLSLGVSSGLAAVPAGTVTELQGKAAVRSAESTEWRRLQLKERLFSGDTVKTEEKSRVTIFLADESVITIGPKAQFQLESFSLNPSRNERQAKAKILAGKTRFHLQRAFGGSSQFNVSTPTAIAGVKGTKFLVWVVSEKLTRVAVIEGLITVRNILPHLPQEVLLQAGYTTSVSTGQPPLAPSLLPENQLREFQEGVAGREKGIITGIGRISGVSDRKDNWRLLDSLPAKDITRYILDQRQERNFPQILPPPPPPPQP